MKRLLLASVFLATLPISALAGEFLVHAGRENKVSFVSRAAMERFEGKTSQLEGRVVVNPDSLGDSITVHLEVDMASLDTGLSKRNQHMRDNHLETKKYPKAIFDGAAVRSPVGARLEPGKSTVFDVEGTFTLHGVSRRLRISISAAYVPQNNSAHISFQTAFPVLLGDYQISRPQFLFLKLAEAQEVRVSGVATASP